MNRIDVHCHFLPDLDDGCTTVDESLNCLRQMAAAGYDRIFCTPHCGAIEFTDLSVSEVAERVRALEGHAQASGIPIQLKSGGELRLTPNIAAGFPDNAVPTYGHQGKYVLADLWEPDWPSWATRAVQWLQSRGHTVIIAHPERMPVLRQKPERIDELASLGVLFQGNLGPLGGHDSADIVALGRRYLLEGRYFMVGSDGHRANHMQHRIDGLKVVAELTTPEKLDELTVKNPGRIWK